LQEFHPELVLCPTDFSESASLALRYANEFAGTWKSKLLVMHVDSLDVPLYFTTEQVNELVEFRKKARSEAESHLARYVRDVIADGAAVETAIVEGSIVGSILHTAETRNAGMIVMGAHGAGGFNRFMMGSVAERVLRETDRPVLLARAGGDSPRPRIDRILCPVNFSAAAFDAFRYAIEVARTFGAELTALHVVEPGASDVQKEELSRTLCDYMPELNRPACTLTHMVKKGNPAEQIIEAVTSSFCDLVVLGTRHRRFFDATVIGSTTSRVARHSPRPVLAVAGTEPA
jgi:nucleotide-binding universal stress UspA family protein